MQKSVVMERVFEYKIMLEDFIVRLVALKQDIHAYSRRKHLTDSFNCLRLNENVILSNEPSKNKGVDTGLTSRV